MSESSISKVKPARDSDATSEHIASRAIHEKLSLEYQNSKSDYPDQLTTIDSEIYSRLPRIPLFTGEVPHRPLISNQVLDKRPYMDMLKDDAAQLKGDLKRIRKAKEEKATEIRPLVAFHIARGRSLEQSTLLTSWELRRPQNVWESAAPTSNVGNQRVLRGKKAQGGK